MVKKTLLQEIGKAIAIARCRAKMTQYGLNHWAGLPDGTTARQNHIAKLEKGELNVTLETLEKIAKACGCRVEVKLRYDRKPKAKIVVDENVPAAIQKIRDAVPA